MADTGWLNPGQVVTNGGGDVAWANTSGAAVDADFDYADCPFLAVGEITDELLADQFAATIPGDATIDGVEVRITKFATRNGIIGDIEDRYICLAPSGSKDGDEKANVGQWQLDSPGQVIYGSPSDLWNLTLDPATVNSSSFGIILQASCVVDSMNAFVDVIQLKVYYTEAGPPAGGNLGAFFDLF